MPKSMRQRLIREFSKEGHEIIDWLLYDSFDNLDLTGSPRTYEFFQQTVGQIAAGRFRTNMKNPGMLPFPESFLITEMWCEFINPDGAVFEVTGSVASGIQDAFQRGWWNFKREPSSLYEGHLSEFYGQQMENSDLQPAVGPFLHGNMNSLVSKLKLRNPIMIRSNAFFVLELNLTIDNPGGGLSADTLIYWYLKGLKRRNK